MAVVEEGAASTPPAPAPIKLSEVYHSPNDLRSYVSLRGPAWKYALGVAYERIPFTMTESESEVERFLTTIRSYGHAVDEAAGRTAILDAIDKIETDHVMRQMPKLHDRDDYEKHVAQYVRRNMKLRKALDAYLAAHTDHEDQLEGWGPLKLDAQAAIKDDV